MTTRQVANAIKANCDAVHRRDITWEQFSETQRALWDYASSRSERFVDLVCGLIR